MTSSNPTHLPEAPPPNIPTPGVRVSTYEFWGDKDIWSITEEVKEEWESPSTSCIFPHSIHLALQILSFWNMVLEDPGQLSREVWASLETRLFRIPGWKNSIMTQGFHLFTQALGALNKWIASSKNACEPASPVQASWSLAVCVFTHGQNCFLVPHKKG